MGSLGRDFLDVHAAFGGKHHEERARDRLGQDGGVELAIDTGLFFDQDRFDPVVTDGHADDGLGRGPRFLGIIRQLDPARLATLSCRHLRLDDARADLAEGVGGFFRRPCEKPLRNGNSGWPQQLFLGDMLDEVHFPYFSQCGPNRVSSLGRSSGMTFTRWVMLRKCW